MIRWLTRIYSGNLEWKLLRQTFKTCKERQINKISSVEFVNVRGKQKEKKFLIQLFIIFDWNWMNFY